MTSSGSVVWGTVSAWGFAVSSGLVSGTVAAVAAGTVSAVAAGTVSSVDSVGASVVSGAAVVSGGRVAGGTVGASVSGWVSNAA